MDLKNKEQWRTFLQAAMESAPPVSPARAIRSVSIGEYVQALRSLESGITEKQRSMLVAHARAPGQALTMSELAALVGFPCYSAANLQYGLLAGKLADALGIPRPEYLVYVIAGFDDDPDTSQSRAHMYPELYAALQELGWVAAEGSPHDSMAVHSASADADRPATAATDGSVLTIQQVITTLERHGFTRLNQSGLKVVRLEHSALTAPLFVKQSSSIHARLQAPLVLHPDHEKQLPDWLAIAGIERGHARYYHNSNLRGFPKRRNGGTTDIAYGVDLGFRHIEALEQLLTRLTGIAPTSDTPATRHAVSAMPDHFDPQDLALTDTEREALIKARIGQGGYREALLAYWGGCAVTDCSVPAMLRASHIKPWHASSASERLDPFNGLLLTPNLDLAFDQGLISFDDHGQILLGEDLDPDSARALNLPPELRLRQIEPRHRAYLVWHREHLFRK
ncbi:HNH endonuclease [Pseudomonas kuykendallii]|uniref:HNH endonuclease n=1 Tax=Pseudomonas kuykendallii TaxID=1007099 RepID=UPI0028A2D87C|nr:HNH endonuclease [Pseudomonas kuykendallii]